MREMQATSRSRGTLARVRGDSSSGIAGWTVVSQRWRRRSAKSEARKKVGPSLVFFEFSVCPPKNGERKLEEQERKNLEHSIRAPTPRRGDSRLGIQSSSPGSNHPRLGVDTNA
ncbi:hypothetical protein PIB30_070211 [Stylosanthes scabra]|uniref:Uncharacterized protein n=1 Tax=Stylosanthes scabra TaxID=79078 RepID=A0ABU6ZM75_9FABA|nr:hypothetical protein [Stylosanthes scabra]